MKTLTLKIAEAHELNDEQVSYWNLLDESCKEVFYAEAVHAQRAGQYWETHNGLDSQRGFTGRDASLAQACSQAFAVSPQKLAESQAADEALRNTVHNCTRCNSKNVESRMIIAGAQAVCFTCLSDTERQMFGIK